uniref:Metallothionein TY1 n=1 Tax=Tabanus yao TaxID=485572 RepID=C1IBZ0_TABYA|nr:metallothionein TY1 [Tabanus yao]
MGCKLCENNCKCTSSKCGSVCNCDQSCSCPCKNKSSDQCCK